MFLHTQRISQRRGAQTQGTPTLRHHSKHGRDFLSLQQTSSFLVTTAIVDSGCSMCVYIYVYSGENKYLTPCRFRKFGQSRKLHFITFMTLFVFDAENKYLNPQANSKNSGSQLPVMCPRSTQISPH